MKDMKRFTMTEELWLPIEGFEDRYEVSNYGQVRSLFYDYRVLKQSCTKTGKNPTVCLSDGEKHYVHLVAELVYSTFFEDASPFDVIKHYDGDTTNNYVTNLYTEVIEDEPGEEWKPIEGYEGIYEISNHGRLKSCQREETYTRPDTGTICHRIRKAKLIEIGDDGWGYKISGLMKNSKSKDVSIHRLVAQAFIPNPENKPHINHIDGNPSNNHVRNLEWVTAQENVADAIQKRGRKKLTDLIKEKYGKKVVCLDNMVHYKSLAEVRDVFGQGGSIDYVIEHRTCYKGYTFVYEYMLEDSSFDAEAYLKETKNRYCKWVHAKKHMEEVQEYMRQQGREPIPFRFVNE